MADWRSDSQILGPATVNGDLNVTGNLTVQGTSGEIVESLIIDGTGAEVFLVRKNGDTGDVFSIDTSTPQLSFSNTGTFQKTFTLSGATITPQLGLVSNGSLRQVMSSFGTATQSNFPYFIKANGTQTSPTVLADGDAIAAFIFSGYDGTDYANAAQIAVVVDGTPGSNGMPGKIQFKTSPAGAQVAVTRFDINNIGNATFTRAANTVNLTASTENTSYLFNASATKTFATGALTLQREGVFKAPTYAFAGASTITVAATTNYEGLPIVGSNATVQVGVNLLLGKVDSTELTSITGSSYQQVIAMHGIANGIGAVSEIVGQKIVGSNPPVSLGNQTATLGQLASVWLEAINYISTTNTRTVTTAATLVIEGPPASGGNVTFTNGPYAQWNKAGVTRLDGGVLFDSTQTTLANYTESTFTPTVTLVGGSGNTVPVYSTNTGRSTRIGNKFFNSVLLVGDGGAEGAGTGQFTMAIGTTAGASNPGGNAPVGTAGNGSASSYILFAAISGGATTMAFEYQSLVNTSLAFTGAEQNNASRQVRLQYWFEV